ncbi:MAG: LysR family transcriptional regulator [Leptothrix sp. (in: b-proteobacteria)]
MPSKIKPPPPFTDAHAAPADLALFVRAVELGSFSAVARERDAVASQVSRAVDRLEALYRVRLLRRSTHGLSLTPEGQTLLTRARQVLAALGDLSDELAAQRGKASGTVRLALSPAMARHFVIPALPQLAEQHPALRLELHAEDRFVDLVAEGFDLALRTNDVRQDGLVARRIGQHQRAVLAAPAYLSRHGTPTHPADLAQHRTITHLSAGHLNRWRFLIDGQLTPHAPRNDFSASSTWLVIEMVLAGLGLGWINTQLVEAQLQHGELIEVLAPFRDPTSIPVYAVMLPDRDRLPRIRAVVEFLAQALGQQPTHRRNVVRSA